jgi:hypothetical protein
LKVIAVVALRRKGPCVLRRPARNDCEARRRGEKRLCEMAASDLSFFKPSPFSATFLEACQAAHYMTLSPRSLTVHACAMPSHIFLGDHGGSDNELSSVQSATIPFLPCNPLPRPLLDAPEDSRPRGGGRWASPRGQGSAGANKRRADTSKWDSGQRAWRLGKGDLRWGRVS